MRDDNRLCRMCGVREVTTSVGVWQGGIEISRTYVCLPCAEKEERLLGGKVSVSLAAISAFIADRQAHRAGADSDKGCPICGVKLAEIVADGLLGCGYCYGRFKNEVTASIKLAQQGNSRHLGKSPLSF